MKTKTKQPDLLSNKTPKQDKTASFTLAAPPVIAAALVKELQGEPTQHLTKGKLLELSKEYCALCRTLKRMEERHKELRDQIRESVPCGVLFIGEKRNRFRINKHFINETPIRYVRKAYYALSVEKV